MICLVLISHPSVNIAIILISLAVSFIMSANHNYYAVNIDIVKMRSGATLGIMNSGFAIYGFIAPMLTGCLVDITNSYSAAFILLTILGLSSVIIMACYL